LFNLKKKALKVCNLKFYVWVNCAV
jgi:hypothetical protein